MEYLSKLLNIVKPTINEDYIKNSNVNYIDNTDNIYEASEFVGLQNNNFSCFINSAIQIFLHSPKLWKELRNLYPDNDMLILLRSEYCSFENFEMNQQGDAVLFLNWLLDKFKNNKIWNQKWVYINTCKVCKNKVIIYDNKNFWRIYPTNLNKYVDYDEDTNTVLEYDGEMSDMLFNQSQDIIQYKCAKCETNTEHTKIEKIKNHPKYMFFHLYNIVNLKINYYETFDLRILDTDCTYELNGIIVHIGTDNAGHYVSYIKGSDSEWYLYNDDTIKHVKDISKILSIKSDERKIVFMWYILSNIVNIE